MEKKNVYLELKGKSQKMIDDFPMGFAFSKKQFEEMKEKLGVTDNNELVSTSAGGFIRKTDSEAYSALFKAINTQDEEAMKDDDYVFQGFLYELGNHEFCITYDPEPTLDVFGITVDELNADERLLSIFNKAKSKYFVSSDSY